jgi:hypothetical protein
MQRAACLSVPLSLCVLLSLSVLLAACGGEEEVAPNPADSAPIVGVLELPISRNNDASVPSGTPRIEMTMTELRVDGTKVIDLNQGRVPPAALSDHAITALTPVLRGTSAALWVSASVPYATLAEVLTTLSAASVRELYFAVRADQSATSPGWMRISRWQVVPYGEDPVRFTNSTPLQWSAFTDVWREVYAACREAGPERYINCDGTGRNIAQGGELQSVLWSRGSGMKITFMQVFVPDAGPPQAQRRRGPELIEGVRAPPPSDPDEDLGPPALEGAFSFRQQEAVAPESAISATARPVCGAQSCQHVVVADATTMSMRVLSFIGAVYANGFQEPQIAFRLAEGQ